MFWHFIYYSTKKLKYFDYLDSVFLLIPCIIYRKDLIKEFNIRHVIEHTLNFF